jgi:asparagine synthase (glutamine-hydrolysing)
MPGIVGIISKIPTVAAKKQLDAMLEAIQHENFYTTGTFGEESLGVHVAWTALRGSFSDGMPVHDERREVTLVFSGEEYPDPVDIHDLQRRGHSFGRESASYLVHCYEEDPGFLSNLNGMYHGLIVDRNRGIVRLFNDRYGMHRLYWHQAADGFYFASEAKAILAVLPHLRECDLQGLGEFVACSCVLENRTVFRDIHVLPAASAWTFRGAQLEHKETYFNPGQWEEQKSLSAREYQQELRSVLLTVLPRYFNGPLPMGIAMTGGLDTRVILASHLPAAGALPGFTFGSMFRDTYDVRIGREVAAICNQPHQVIEVGNEFLGNFAAYAERCISMTEGTVDLYRASDLYLSEKVRQIVPAKIVGTYGSEIVRYAVMFKPDPPLPSLFRQEFLPQIQKATETYTALRRLHPVTFAAFCQSPWYHHGILALEQSQLTVKSPFMDNEFVRTVYRAPKQPGPGDDVRIGLIQDGSPALARIRSDRGIGGEGSPIGGYLTHAFREFTFKAEYAYDYGMPQSLARVDHLFSSLHLERIFFGRHKLLHFRTWYRDQLAEYVREILLDPLTLSRPILDPKVVRLIVDGHTRHGLNYTTAIHKLLTIELLHRLFFDRSK